MAKPKTRSTPTASAQAASFLMGTAGMPAGLDPDAAKGAKPYALGSAAYVGSPTSGLRPPTSVPGSQDVPGGGSTQEELVRRSNFWRDNYNPLRGLTIARLMALFEQAERGAFSEIQLTLRKAEKRFPVLKGFLEKLLSSIEELEGKVRVKEQLPEGATDAMAEAQRQFLQARYDLLKNFKTAIAQIALADLRGYAVLQKHRFPDGPNAGAVEELYWLEPWCWVRDGFYGDFYYNENSQFGIGLGTCQATLGEDNRIGSNAMPRADFVIRESESPLYEIALIAFLNWLMGRKDYAAFVEIFGLPNAIITMPPNIPVGKESEYQTAAEKVARGVSGALPNGSDAKFPTSSVRGESPFETFCGAQEKDFCLAGTGGQLTMLAAQHGGLGKGGAEEHDAAWQKIAVTKAVRINDVLHADFDIPELTAQFPGQPICVQFALGTRDEKDAGAICTAVAAVTVQGSGIKPDLDWLNEATGFKFVEAELPEPATDPSPDRERSPLAAPRPGERSGGSDAVPEKPIANRALILNHAADGDPDAADAIAATLHDTLLPLLKRLEAIANVDDAAIQQHMIEKLLKDFPAISAAIEADNSLAKKLSPLLEQNLILGLSGKVKNRGGMVLNGGGNPNHDAHGLFSSDASGGGGEKVYRETRVPIHPEAARQLGLKSQSVFADHAALAAKHPELFHSSAEAKEYVEHVAAHPTHILPGNQPDHRLIVRREEENKAVALEIEQRGGKYRVRSAHTVSEDQFQQRLKTAGPGATLGISRVNPKNRASETPSRLLDTSHSVPPAAIQRIYQQP